MLTEAQVELGLELLDEEYRYVDRPLSRFQRTAWTTVLERLDHGELEPALRTLPSGRRPSPLDVLQAVHAARRGDAAPVVRAKLPDGLLEARKALARDA